jgi:hypothetical protein
MLAAPSSSPVGTTVNISNAANSPCGGAQGDAPAETLLTVTKPDGVTVTDATALSSSAGDWSYAYTGTDQVGTYQVTGFCQDVPATLRATATDFTYTDTSFEIVAAVTTVTTATPATTVTTAAAAEPATATPARPTFTG